MSKFEINSDGTKAIATLKSMFKFPVGSEVHVQCDVAQCPGGCAVEACPGDVYSASAIKGDGRPKKPEDSSMPATTTVFVLDPAEAPRSYFQFEIISKNKSKCSIR